MFLFKRRESVTREKKEKPNDDNNNNAIKENPAGEKQIMVVAKSSGALKK
jgi:hypothetical protein